jgi:predicted phosphodiesterase
MALSAKYGIISDIHANYQALKVALEFLAANNVDKYFCLGDLVGYGAEPFECIQAIRDKPNIYTIAGNHDRQVIGEKDPRMRKTATKVLVWTQDNISPSNARYLKQLPQGMTVDDTFILVHGSLVERDAYILTRQEIDKNLQCMFSDFPGLKLCFFGHTHLPMLIGTKAVITDLKETKSFQLNRNDTYLINAGSVGQPRDRCPFASFGIFDAQAWTMTFVRRPYDIRAAQRAIIDNGLPEKFARRLAVGV